MIDAPDEDLLRAFEPVVRYTRGESFLPMSVSTYLASAVRVRRDAGTGVMEVEAGPLTEEVLGNSSASSGGRRYTEYITVAGAGETDDVTDLFRGRGTQAVGFRSGTGRLARVGYTSRLIDALFSLSLLARGRVPGSLALRGVERYRAAVAGEDHLHPYYGRVVRTATWTVLQYWFFYAFNDWRSGFKGANDHEADWEQILIYLDRDAAGHADPVWAAYAQHDYHGSELRRRWDDDAELELVGNHPVVHAGAGSHASYFRPGEYLAEQELRLPTAIRRVVNTIARLMDSARTRDDERMLPIAFVDYARGDGECIGPGADRVWTPVVLNGQTWVTGFSGLWGVSVQDPFQGENAPAGPMYNRDGSLRQSWTDPVAFAGLELTPPPSLEAELTSAQIADAERRQEELARRIPDLERELAATGSEVGASRSAASKSADGRELADMRQELTLLHAEREQVALRLARLGHRLAQVQAGQRDDPQAHLQRKAEPTDPNDAKAGALLEIWSAASIGLLLLALVGALLLAPELGIVVAIIVIAAFVLVESLLRGRLANTLALWTRLLALVAVAVLVASFWSAVLIGVAIAAGIFVLRENVGEFLSADRGG